MDYKRIKTEREFVTEYGDSWRSLVKYSWNSNGMDKFLGKPLEAFSNAARCRFDFSEDMLISCSKEEYDEAIAHRQAIVDTYDRIKFVESSLDGNGLVRVSVQPPLGRYNFIVYTSPTGNCQLSSLCYFNNLLLPVIPDEFVQAAVDLATKYTRKTLFLFDVSHNIYHSGRIQKLFKEFIEPQEYISTNGSEMVIGGIQLS